MTAFENSAAWDARLRRSERWSRGLLCASAALAVGLGVALVELTDWVQSPRTIETGRLVLRDSEGTPRAVFEADEQGHAALRMTDREGVEQLRLSTKATAEGPETALEIEPRGRGLTLKAGQEGALDFIAAEGSESSFSLGPNRFSGAATSAAFEPKALGRLLERTLPDHEAIKSEVEAEAEAESASPVPAFRSGPAP